MVLVFLHHHVEVKCTLRMANATCIDHARGQVLRTLDLYMLQFYLRKSTVFLTWDRIYNVWLIVVNGLVGFARVTV
jgi:endonuclease I